MEPGLHLGDGVAWLESQPPDSLDGIFSDPPWGAGPDIMGQSTWQTLLARVLWAAERVVRADGHVMVWYGQAMLDPIFRYVLPHTRLYLNAILMIRVEPHRAFARYSSSEYIFVLGRMRFAPPRSRAYAFQEYVCKPSGQAGGAHPCGKNQETVAQILRDWFRPGDVICDPFAGSDTTGWAAKRLGMSCYSFEVDPAMYATATARHTQQDLFLAPPAPPRPSGFAGVMP
jgi:hypothetical protein